MIDVDIVHFIFVATDDEIGQLHHLRVGKQPDPFEADRTRKPDRRVGDLFHDFRSCHHQFQTTKVVLQFDFVNLPVAANHRCHRFAVGGIEKCLDQTFGRHIQKSCHFLDCSRIWCRYFLQRLLRLPGYRLRADRVGLFNIGGVIAVIAEEQQFLARLSIYDHHKFVRHLPPHRARIRFHLANIQPAPVEHRKVCVNHFLIGQLMRFGVKVESISVLHQELAPPHQTEARADFIAELDLNLVEVEWQLPVAS